jgi:hypothetical protein
MKMPPLMVQNAGSNILGRKDNLKEGIMTDKYVLDASGCPQLEPDLIKWAMWFETANRRIAFDAYGDTSVSTVFLGLDHNFGDGPPALWETAIFGGDHDGDTTRYSTRADAIQGHNIAKAIVSKELINE